LYSSAVNNFVHMICT